MSSRVLVVAPHPDDEILGVGGTMARMIRDNDEVIVAVATRGEPPRYCEDDVRHVRDEACAAARHVGYALRFLDLPLTRLNTRPTHEINDVFTALVNDVKPETVFIPFGGDRHEDHRQTFRACMVALRPTAERSVRRVLCYETVSGTHWIAPGIEQGFEPNLWVDISETLGDKLAAMRCYASQVRPPPEARSLQAIEALARWRGSVASMEAAEAFMVVWSHTRGGDRCLTST